jgi:hypothetical protein
MDEKYIFDVNNENIGPLDDTSIQQGIHEGIITNDTLAWCSGMDDWQPVGHIPELMEAYNDLLSKQLINPALPAHSNASEQKIPLPFSQKAGQRSNDQDQGSPERLKWFEANRYRFVRWSSNATEKGKLPLRKKIIQRSKKTLPVILGAAIVMATLILLVLPKFTKTGHQTTVSNVGDVQQVKQVGSDWIEQYNEIREESNYFEKRWNDSHRYNIVDTQENTYVLESYDFYKNSNEKKAIDN